MGGVLVQAKPIPSASLLLAHTLALVTSRGTEVYSLVAVKQAEYIQTVQAKDAQTIYFTLRQLDGEADRVRTKAVV